MSFCKVGKPDRLMLFSVSENQGISCGHHGTHGMSCRLTAYGIQFRQTTRLIGEGGTNAASHAANDFTFKDALGSTGTGSRTSMQRSDLGTVRLGKVRLVATKTRARGYLLDLMSALCTHINNLGLIMGIIRAIKEDAKGVENAMVHIQLKSTQQRPFLSR